MLSGWIVRSGIPNTIYHLWSRATIRIPPLEGTYESSWYKTKWYHSVPPTSKWPGGEIPLAIKKCIESSSDKHQLDWRTPYGTARYSSTGSRRICHVLRPKWSTVRRYSCQAISFFLKLRKILPRWCLDYVTLCSVNNSFLLDDMRAGYIHSFWPAHGNSSVRLSRCARLTGPYDGPYKVTRRTNKHFALEVNGNIKEYSVDHLRPARSDAQLLNTAPQGNQPVLLQVTRSAGSLRCSTDLSGRICNRLGGGDVAPTM